jgi:CubicO group peptidase (beta-lactamase class C family)
MSHIPVDGGARAYPDLSRKKTAENPMRFDVEKLGAIAPMLQGVVDAGDLSGAVTLVWRKGDTVRLDTAGKRDIEHNLPMQRDTLFRIASMTKPVTSVAAMMLVEEGWIALDSPIEKWLPEFSNMRVLDDPAGPLDRTHASPRPITLEDLLTHRAGLAYNFTSVGPLSKAHEDALGNILDCPLGPDEWLKRLGQLPLSYAPGERFHYSHATEVLGYLIGRAVGKSYRDFLFERIFGPLGMKDTDFYTPPEKRSRAAVMYQQVEGRLKVVPLRQYDSPPEFTGGGGGLTSTLDDYLSFARMMLNGGELDGRRYLKRQTVELMRTNRLTEAQRAIPFLGLPYWAGSGFGLGVSVVLDPEKHAWMGAASKGSFGWPGAFGTWWQADPVEDMILIFLIQNYTSLTSDSVLAGRAVTGARLACPMFQKIVYGALMD